jgi:tRNA U34 5-methylaminomethyl-2-thiouridine-forming methyltransferase MnmC
MNQLVLTSDGSHTIYVPELDEHYHSVHGAVQESEHIFIKSGYDFCKADPLRIFEVGLGTGLNALLTAVKSLTGGRKVLYTAIERYPVDPHISGMLNHDRFAGTRGKEISDLIFSSPWGMEMKICENFSLRKINGNLITDSLKGEYDLIYFDAFGPDKQPEMWSPAIFRKISSVTAPGGILVTYSAKGQVKRDLTEAGFSVTLLPGPPGKRQIIRAIKI